MNHNPVDYVQVFWLTVGAVSVLMFLAWSCGCFEIDKFKKGDRVHIIHSPLPPAVVIDVQDHSARLEFAEYPQITIWVDESRLEAA